MGHNRRRSHSSSSSSSSSSDEEKRKWKNDKHDKHGPAYGQAAFPTPSHGFPQAAGVAHAGPGPSFASPPSFPQVAGGHMPQVPMPSFPGAEHGAGHGLPPSRDIEGHTGAAPPPYASAPSAPPSSGFRVPLSDNMPFPTQQAGPPVVVDADGRTPVYIGSALFERAVHPCKIIPTFQPPARVAWGGGEHEHRGRYDLLPFDPNTMEWVPASHGQLPPGRRPVEGGYEENGEKLYHALASVQGVRVPGKTGSHLRGANVPFGGQEHCVEQYEILVWRH